MRTTRTSSLSAALFGRTKRDVLGLFFGRPDEAFYLRQAAELTGISPGTLQRELRRLSDAGILKRSSHGRQIYYQADRACPVFEELRGLVVKTVGVLGALQSALAGLGDRVSLAFIFGSLARGEERSASDVDLLIVGTASFDEIVAAVATAEKSLGREINPTVYTAEELRRKLAEGHHFVRSVVSGPKLFLIGGEHDVARLARGTVD